MPRRATSWIVALLTVLAAVVLAPPRLAAADPTAKDAADARALLDAIATSPSKDERLAAATKLAELAPRVVATLGEFLGRARATTPDQRREVLIAIKASVPDKDGRFVSPGRMKEQQVRDDDAFDWLAQLAELPADAVDPAARGEVTADVAALRALAASKQVDAARLILDAGFAEATMIYRDECGRRLRAMAPYSIPALMLASQPPLRERGDAGLQRYATYQLERLDRQDPAKALDAAAGDEDLAIAILDAFRAREHREAVRTVLDHVDDDAPRVRAAARAAWLAYVSEPHPRPPPKRRLTLPGGKLAEKETPLWLNSLQLAEIELGRLSEELLGEPVPDEVDLVAQTEKVFAHYDRVRAARDAELYAEGRAAAEGGDLERAIAVFDRLLAEDPLRAERAAMASSYLARAESLAGEERWADAAALYSKAHGLDPEGEQATDALASHYYALGKAQEAEGKDGAAAFRRAVELRPDHREAKRAAAVALGGAADGARPQWMLYLAGAVALGAAGLLVAGLRRRAARP